MLSENVETLERGNASRTYGYVSGKVVSQLQNNALEAISLDLIFTKDMHINLANLQELIATNEIERSRFEEFRVFGEIKHRIVNELSALEIDYPKLTLYQIHPNFRYLKIE